jgi:dTMP kinase
MFITFEGPDKAGKTTQIELLKKYAERKNYDWVFTRNPGATVLGNKLRDIVLDSNEVISDKAELMLYLADRAHHVDEVLKPNLQAGKVVICDRYTDSTVAYQGHGRGIDLKSINIMNNLVTDSIVPDLTVMLMVSDQEAARRTKEMDRLESENKLFFVRVRNGYKTIAKENPSRVRIIEVDGLSKEDVHERILKLISSVMGETLSA